MSILLAIAWRNIWRNSRRSWVLISSITVGMIGYLGMTSFSRGFLEQMVETAINLRGGHIMVAAKGYHEQPQIRTFIKNPERVISVLADIPELNYAPLVSFSGMISSAEHSGAAIINGIVPEMESDVTIVATSIKQGSYLEDATEEFPIILGEALAEKLNVRLGEKVVLMTSDLNNDIASGAYRIVGLFETASTDFDKAFVYIRQEQAQSLVGYEEQLTAFTLRLEHPELLNSVMARLKSKLDTEALEILSWKDRNPILVLSRDLYEFSLAIIAIILFVAIAFSIANSFLMVITERIHEFGIMMANGVLPKKIRSMLYLEALFMAGIGLSLGCVISFAAIGYLNRTGLDLSDFAEGLSKFGVGAVVYPEIAFLDLFVGLAVIIAIIFSSVLYPAFKASRFEVVDAIQFV